MNNFVRFYARRRSDLTKTEKNALCLHSLLNIRVIYINIFSHSFVDCCVLKGFFTYTECARARVHRKYCNNFWRTVFKLLDWVSAGLLCSAACPLQCLVVCLFVCLSTLTLLMQCKYWTVESFLFFYIGSSFNWLWFYWTRVYICGTLTCVLWCVL